MSQTSELGIVVPIASAVIAAMATTLAAVLPVWLKLKHEREERRENDRLLREQQFILESDVDEIDNQPDRDDDRLRSLEARIAHLERQLGRPELGTAGAPEGIFPPASDQVPIAPLLSAGPGPLMGRDKRAYLVGADPKGKSVRWLVKVHDYRGKAIYVYDLLTGAWSKIADARNRNIADEIARYGRIGHEIDHPGTIRLNDAKNWVEHAREEAGRLHLSIEEQPSSPIPNPPAGP